MGFTDFPETYLRLKGLVKQEQDHCKHLKIHSDAYKKMSDEGKRAVDQLTKQGKELEEKQCKN